ncbi:MAG: hypothetical protein JST91_17675 [Actinobacteria bacterium]|nr:hypothetical protein [Actinomycetota bacterium]
MTRTVRVATSDGDILSGELAALGWTVEDRDADTPLDLLIVAPAPQPPTGHMWSPGDAMDAVAEVIDRIVAQRDRLRSRHGLAVVAVADSAQHAAVARAAGGVVSAALAMAVQVLAADWAPDVRCLLVVIGDAGPHRLAAAVHWLTTPGAPALTGQTVDLAALGHAVLRVPGAQPPG